MRALIAVGIALGGFLVGRRGFEALVEALRGLGFGVGPATVVASLPYVACSAVLALAALRLAVWPRARLAEHFPARGALTQLSTGFCLGAAFVAATLAVELAAGLAGVTAAGAGRGLARSLAAGLVTLGAIAVAEELVFRLALLETLARLTSWPGAVVLSSIAYAAVHAGGGRWWPVYLASLACFGIVACQLYAARRTLWLPIGAHWAWDFASFAAFQALPLVLRRPAWLAGLPDQLSAGLVMLLVLALTAATLTWRARRGHFVTIRTDPGWRTERGTSHTSPRR